MTRLDMEGVMAQGADGARRRSERADRSDGPILVWLRKDLRLADNPALAAAAATGRPVIPLYILDETPGVRPMGGASLWWLDKSLTALAASLEAIGSRLILRRGPAREVLDDIVAHARPAAVVWNRLYDAAAIDRDSAIKAWLKDEGVACESFNAGLLNEPWTVKNGSGQPYKVFTPYWRAARDQAAPRPCRPAPKALTAPSTGRAPRRWRLEAASDESPTGPGLRPVDARRGRRAGAAGRLPVRPCRGLRPPARHSRRRGHLAPVAAPALRRDRPAPGLGRGPHAAAAGDAPAGQVEKFLSEVGWREFNHSILFHNPTCPRPTSGPSSTAFPGCATTPPSRPGAGARPAIRSSTPGCASCGPPASCTTACG
jgi:deoxyribodipyrimidine photo-lyase